MAKKPQRTGKPNSPQQPKAAMGKSVPVSGNASPKAVGKKSTPAGGKYLEPLIVAGIALVTWLFYSNATENQFTNWDDLGYVLTNPLIKDSSAEGFKRLWSIDSPVMGNYHPLTIVTYWWEYGKHGLEPWIYHFDSIIYHIITTVAVYLFAKVLTHNRIAASIVAALFALHPMHVESVTWIAGRKDILYGMFYMLACTTHILYIRSEKSRATMWFVLTIVLFALSLFCKSVGVTLPVVLLFIDYYEQRKLNFRLLLEKIPLFALSLTFGLLSVYAQKDIGALGTLDVKFTALERLALGCYALVTYVWKALIPVGMTNFYPYPTKVGESLSATYYVFPLIVAAAGFLVWKYGRKNRMLIFGLSFFIINLLLLLQFIPVGGAIMSDRYTYIPYIGLFLITATWVAKQFDNNTSLAKPALAGSVGLCLAFGYLTHERNKDWYDAVTLWQDAIQKDPQSPIGYFYLGQEYYTRFESALTQQDRQKYGDSAYYYFQMSVAHKPDYTSPIVCMGEYERSIGRLDDAKKHYLQALAIKDESESAYLGLGVVYSIQQKFDSAGVAFRKALSMKKYFPEGHSNYANYLEITGRTDSALKEYEYSISQNPDAYIPYMNRGRIYIKLKQYDKAIADYSRASTIKPDNPEPYYMRAQCYALAGKKAEARRDLAEARRKGFSQVDANLEAMIK